MKTAENFELNIHYNGRDLVFPAQLLQFGFSYKINVDVNGTIISFERDEEKNWRALVDPDKMDSKIDANLINAIIFSLEEF